MRDTELVEPVAKLISWMRSKGVDPDPTGAFGLLGWFNVTERHIKNVLEAEANATLAVHFYFAVNEPNNFVFWERARGANGASTAKEHKCRSVKQIWALGFEPAVDSATGTIELTEQWLSARGLEMVALRDGVFPRHLRGDHDLLATAGQRPAHQRLGVSIAIHLGGVEEVDAGVAAGAQGGDRIPLILRPPGTAAANGPTPLAHHRDFQPGPSQRPVFHPPAP